MNYKKSKLYCLKPLFLRKKMPNRRPVRQMPKPNPRAIEQRLMKLASHRRPIDRLLFKVA